MTAESNKQVIRDFYEEVLCGHNLDVVDRYMHEDYVQHNPLAAQGSAGFIEFHESFFSAIPDARTTINMMVAEGDLVALHTHQVWPGGDEYVTMDFFRCDDSGKIVEHWDSIQEIPDKSENDNTMY